MQTLIIYDNTGYVIGIHGGEPAPREPIGIPFLWVDIPEGRQLKINNGIGVNVSVTPHQVILEDIPPSKVETLESQVADLTYQLMIKGVL